jgi:2',3'-cyclic-nucleotide 2'-phosphodiesterase (5'-nucleotidase family)
MRKSNYPLILITLFLHVSCNPAFRSASVQYGNYRIRQADNADAAINQLIKPYSDSINKSMNDVIGENATLLEKKSKKSELGYFMADAFLYMAKQKFSTNVDAAFVNHGGIRLNELTAGKITRGKIFELMPFDNLLVLQKVNGRILKQYLDTLALGDAVNLSGISMTISDTKAKNIMVGDRPLDENKDYILANSDYNINNSELLKSLPVQNIGYLQRDAIIDYVIMFSRNGKKISVENNNRVVYAE